MAPLPPGEVIEFRTSETDRRQRVVALTVEGLTLLRSAKKLWEAAESRFEEAFGQANAVGLRALMRQITTVEFPSTQAQIAEPSGAARNKPLGRV
jgi:hypothetical protein